MTETRKSPTRSFWRAWLRSHRSRSLWALYALAVAWPLLDQLGRHSPFLIHHRLDGVDVLLLLASLVVGLPLLLAVLPALATRLLGETVGRLLHRALLAALGALWLLQIGRRLMAWDSELAFSLSAVGGLGLAWLYGRLVVLRLFLTFLTLALPCAALLFLARPSVLDLLIETRPPQVSVQRPQVMAPVVLVIFDEFPLLSLVDARYEIQEDLYPNFAYLASQGTWYRNATTVWERTEEAISSVMTGTFAARDEPPTLSRYPNNLFTLLAGSHQIQAFERLTRLAPPDTRSQEGGNRRDRLRMLSGDLGVLMLHLLAPEDLQGRLPPIDENWGDFLERGSKVPRADAGFPLQDPRRRAARFRNFLKAIEEDVQQDQAEQKPGFYFLHSLLPHLPVGYLPSGAYFSGSPFFEGDIREVWKNNPWFSHLIYQRHLLQVRFVDHLIGELVATLKRQGLWDRTLLVITADHGAANWPGRSRRLPAETHADDILRVPLFVKAPQQRQGVIDDRSLQSIDLLPTLAEILGVEVPWEVDGRSLLSQAEAPRKVLFDRFGNVLAFSGTFQPDLASLRHKLRLFGQETSDPYHHYRLGPWGSLLGRPLDEVARDDEQAEATVRIDQESYLAQHQARNGASESYYVPAEITGTLQVPHLANEAVFFAVTLGDTVQAVGNTKLNEDGRGLFSALMPDWALRPGENPWRISVLRGTPEDARRIDAAVRP